MQSKIDYHSLEKHSEDERSGITHNSEERLRSLRALAAELKDIFESTYTSGAQLKVTGKIEISLVESNELQSKKTEVHQNALSAP